jgi:hypothetical protein
MKRREAHDALDRIETDYATLVKTLKWLSRMDANSWIKEKVKEVL